MLLNTSHQPYRNAWPGIRAFVGGILILTLFLGSLIQRYVTLLYVVLSKTATAEQIIDSILNYLGTFSSQIAVGALAKKKHDLDEGPSCS